MSDELVVVTVTYSPGPHLHRFLATLAHATDRPWQSMAFFALGATQLAVALGSRARPGSRANPMLLLAVAAALGLQFAGLYVPILNELLGTQPVALVDLLASRSAVPLHEVEDKEDIRQNHAYLAPADYHVLIEPGRLALSTEAEVWFSRPSVDVLTGLKTVAKHPRTHAAGQACRLQLAAFAT